METLSVALGLQNPIRDCPEAVSLLDVITISVLLKRLARLLTFGSLLSLSRTNSTYRAVLHGFSMPSSSSCHSSDNEDTISISETETLCSDNGSLCPTESDTIYSVNDSAQDTADGGVRPDLNIGWHQTKLWKNLKSMTIMKCSESFHKKGEDCETCRICSMPVCEACSIRSSFTRIGSAYDNRKRLLCDTCSESGNPHQERLRYGPGSGRIDYRNLGRCNCTVKDSLLCSKCRDQHIPRHNDKVWQCAGYRCQKPVHRAWGVRVCLWCNGNIPGHRNREDYWLAFDSRFARGSEVERKRLDWHCITY